LALNYAIQEHLLYRGEELAYIYKIECIRKCLNEVMSNICPLLCGKIGEELIIPYAIPSVDSVCCEIVSSLLKNSKFAMCLLLNVKGKDKNRSGLQIYLDHCPEDSDELITQCVILNSL